MGLQQRRDIINRKSIGAGYNKGRFAVFLTPQNFNIRSNTNVCSVFRLVTCFRARWSNRTAQQQVLERPLYSDVGSMLGGDDVQ